MYGWRQLRAMNHQLQKREQQTSLLSHHRSLVQFGLGNVMGNVQYPQVPSYEIHAG